LADSWSFALFSVSFLPFPPRRLHPDRGGLVRTRFRASPPPLFLQNTLIAAPTGSVRDPGRTYFERPGRCDPLPEVSPWVFPLSNDVQKKFALSLLFSPQRSGFWSAPGVRPRSPFATAPPGHDPGSRSSFFFSLRSASARCERGKRSTPCFLSFPGSNSTSFCSAAA